MSWDVAIWDTSLWDLSGWSGPSNVFMQTMKTLLRQQLGITNFSVIYRTFTLGTRDTWSGWRLKTASETSINMFLIHKTANRIQLITGFYPILDVVGITDSDIQTGQQIKDTESKYYRIIGVRDIPYRVGIKRCEMQAENIYEADYSAPTWSKTRASDARYKTKLWLETYLRAAQITKDDDSTLASWAVIFANPPYQIGDEFRASTSPLNGLYTVDKPETEALIDITKKNYGYHDKVPIHICTVDSTGCSAEALAAKMEAELRYVFENYPLGSVRSFEHGKPTFVNLGDMKMFDTTITLGYKRDVAT